MVAGGGNIMRKTPQEAYDLIENMTHHHFQWDAKVYYDTTTDMSAHYSKTTFALNEQVEKCYKFRNRSFDADGDILLLEKLLNIDSTRDLPPQELNNEIFDAERDILLLEKLLDIDSTKDPPPQELNNDLEGDILFLETLLKDDPSDARTLRSIHLLGNHQIPF
ncbi:hypothetical protein Tco_0626105 [Tanacetum coccineum]|uniref:Uncharacterized protein n=1 Tax=Tanacetum coccineum TaxID=301880 RepID=A0ABQ4WIP3_9ASTR